MEARVGTQNACPIAAVGTAMRIDWAAALTCLVSPALGDRLAEAVCQVPLLAFHSVEYFDTHAGAVQAISSLVLVVVTGWYVLLTRRMAKAALESRRPYVFIDFRSEGRQHGELVLGNDGDRSAQDIQLAALVVGSDELAESLRSVISGTRRVSYLAPGRRYRFRMTLPKDGVFDRPEDDHVLMKFGVSYSGEGRQFAEDFEIDVSALQDVLLTSFTDPGEAIAGSIKDLASIERGRASSDRMQSMLQPRRKKCPVCASLIDAEATKCPNCLEWLPLTELGDADSSPDGPLSGPSSTMD